MRINETFNNLPQPKKANYLHYNKFLKTYDEFISETDNVSDEDIFNQTFDLVIFQRGSSFDNLLSRFIYNHNGFKQEPYCCLKYIASSIKSVSEGKEIKISAEKIKERLTNNAKNELNNFIPSPYWLKAIEGSTAKTIHDIIRTYPLASWQVGVDIEILSDVKTIWIKLPNINENFEIIKKVMSFYGYFLAKTETLPDSRFENWSILTFEPYYQPYITEEVRDNCEKLFHLSPKKFEEKILKNGLCPQSKNDLFDYPPRVYMFKESTYSYNEDDFIDISEDYLKRFARELFTARLLKTSDDRFYNIYEIDLKKINDDVEFCCDINTIPFGIFTYSNISPNAIRLIKTFEVL